MLAIYNSNFRGVLIGFASFILISFTLRAFYYHKYAVDGKLDILSQEESPIRNSTLGFQSIFVLNLPSRTDRRDHMMSMAMEGHGPTLKYDWRAGVMTADVKKPPPKWKAEDNAPGGLGSLQGHMNILEEIVEKNIETAVIFEDDIAWGPDLQNQLVKFSHTLPLLDIEISPSVPYGTEWDILWLGTCGNPPATGDAVVFKMESLSPTARTHVWLVDGGTVCTYAYGVTKESARRIIHHMKRINQPYDLELSQFCGYSKCPLIWPSLFSARKMGSNIDADRNSTADNVDILTAAGTEDISVVEPLMP